MMQPPQGTTFYGHDFSAAVAYWCDQCGCLATFDIDDKGQAVADRFQYVSARHPDSHECACHDIIEAHNAGPAAFGSASMPPDPGIRPRLRSV